jgi:molecular chaperone GrpE
MKKQKQKKKSATPKDSEKDSSAADSAAAGEDSECTEPESADADDKSAAADDKVPDREVLEDRLLRLQADFENFKKRTHRERGELVRRAAENLMTELLPILDHFELGFENASNHEANPAVVEGFRIVYDQMVSGLKKHGLEPIDAMGQAFDPHLHEAITHLPSEDRPADSVIQQTRRGYMLGDRLLRAAQVVVSSGPAVEEQGVASMTPENAGDGKEES